MVNGQAIRLALLVGLAACAPAPPPSAPASPTLYRGGRDPAPARSMAETRGAALGAAQAVADASRARPIEAAAAPFLASAPIGRAFLAHDGARALARGAPPERCPAAALETAPAGAAPEAVAARALGRCLAALEALGRGAACGCETLAVDDVVLAPPEALAYAPGVGARLLGLGRPGPLVARERVDEGGELVIEFADASGVVALARLSGDGRAVLRPPQGRGALRGRRERLGWRRGRLVERLLLEGPDGARAIALINFEPADIAAAGPALAAWPRR